MRWGKLVEDSRGGDVRGWKEHFSPVARYTVESWSEFGESSTETGAIAPAPCLYCEKKVQIPVDAPLLQNVHRFGGKRRNSLGTEWYQWRSSSIGEDPLPTALSWIPSPSTPLSKGDDVRINHPPLLTPPLRDSAPGSAAKHRMDTIGRWCRNGDATSPLISFNWRGNLSPEISSVAQKFLDGVDVDFILANVCSVTHLGGRLNAMSGEVRISARHTQDAPLSKRAQLIAGLNCWRAKNPELADQVVGYHTRGVMPVYRVGALPTPRVRGFPYKKQSLEIMGKLRNDVRQCSDYDQIFCTPPTLVTKKMPGRTLSTEMRLIQDVRSVSIFCDKADYIRCANPTPEDLAARVKYMDRRFP